MANASVPKRTGKFESPLTFAGPFGLVERRTVFVVTVPHMASFDLPANFTTIASLTHRQIGKGGNSDIP